MNKHIGRYKEQAQENNNHNHSDKTFDYFLQHRVHNAISLHAQPSEDRTPLVGVFLKKQGRHKTCPCSRYDYWFTNSAVEWYHFIDG
jgi:hypothetical protein